MTTTTIIPAENALTALRTAMALEDIKDALTVAIRNSRTLTSTQGLSLAQGYVRTSIDRLIESGQKDAGVDLALEAARKALVPLRTRASLTAIAQIKAL